MSSSQRRRNQPLSKQIPLTDKSLRLTLTQSAVTNILTSLLVLLLVSKLAKDLHWRAHIQATVSEKPMKAHMRWVLSSITTSGVAVLLFTSTINCYKKSWHGKCCHHPRWETHQVVLLNTESETAWFKDLPDTFCKLCAKLQFINQSVPPVLSHNWIFKFNLLSQSQPQTPQVSGKACTKLPMPGQPPAIIPGNSPAPPTLARSPIKRKNNLNITIV